MEIETPAPLEAVGRLLEHVKTEGVERTVLAGWPLCVPPAFALRQSAVAPLSPTPQTRFGVYSQHWPEQGLQSATAPVLTFVAQGAADLPMGVTQQMRKSAPDEGSPEEQLWLRLNAPALLVVPPGVPHADGKHPHAMPGEGAPPDSCLLWVLALPEGVICHICRTQDEWHKPGRHIFVPDAHLTSLCELLIEELNAKRASWRAGAALLLQTLALHLHDALAQGLSLPLEREMRLVGTEKRAFTGPIAFKRAHRFIRTHLSEPLDVDRIASYAGLSPSQLNRIFRDETGCAVKQFVTRCRMETAHHLLATSQLSITHVARLVGYPQLAPFSRAFRAFAGVAPTQVRLQDDSPPDNQ